MPCRVLEDELSSGFQTRDEAPRWVSPVTPLPGFTSSLWGEVSGQGAAPDPHAPGTASPSDTGSVLQALRWPGRGVGVGRVL